MSAAFHRPIRSGFTLIEILVAVAVLALLIAIIGQIVSTASKVTTISNKHIDANTQARTVFDRMATDFSRMVKRNDVDYIFFKANATTTGPNDTMYFFSEGASYYNTSLFTSNLKNSVSVVGYRINNGNGGSFTSGTPPYGQLERLGRFLQWDAQSIASFPPVAFLTYPPAGTASGNTYSAAYLNSTIQGAYATCGLLTNGSGSKALVGTLAKNFNDSGDPSYHVLGSNVFRFEFSFQMKDGTESIIPVMTQSAANGLPTATTITTTPPTATAASPTYTVGSRWYDSSNQIGYICVDATASKAVWHEIGLQDISAIVVTIAVIDNQGQLYLKTHPTINPVTTLAAQFVDSPDPSISSPSGIAQTWNAAITPTSATVPSAVSTATGLPQSMVSQIRVYQRFFYINNL